MFSTTEICGLCGLDIMLLNNWVRKGWIVPAERGRAGRGNASRYTSQQAVGLSLLSALIKDFGSSLGRPTIHAVMSPSSLQGEPFAQWLSTETKAVFHQIAERINNLSNE